VNARVNKLVSNKLAPGRIVRVRARCLTLAELASARRAGRVHSAEWIDGQHRPLAWRLAAHTERMRMFAQAELALV